MEFSLIIACSALMVVDGDTVRCDGELLRMLGDGVPDVWGVDTPELRHYDCPEELTMARAARDRLAELLSIPGVLIEDGGERGGFGRRLVKIWVPLSEGRYQTAGAILMAEGLAREWRPGRTIDWCA